LSCWINTGTSSSQCYKDTPSSSGKSSSRCYTPVLVVVTVQVSHQSSSGKSSSRCYTPVLVVVTVQVSYQSSSGKSSSRCHTPVLAVVTVQVSHQSSSGKSSSRFYTPVLVVVTVQVSHQSSSGKSSSQCSSGGDLDLLLRRPVRQKRLRTSFKHHELRIMKSYFALNHNPDAKDLKQLSIKTGLSKRVLQVTCKLRQFLTSAQSPNDSLEDDRKDYNSFFVYPYHFCSLFFLLSYN